jgi:thiol-disulfide isomerase/thioredoxin
LVALAVAVALSGGATGPAMPDNATVAIEGSSLPVYPGDPSNDPAVGLPAPNLMGTSFTGDEVNIVDDGRPKVILFLAHWCRFCQQEVPALQRYQQQTGFPASVDLYSVATAYASDRPNWPPSEWLHREGWSFPVVVDDPRASAYLAYGQGAFPYYVFVDGSGQVALRLSGQQDPAVLVGLMEQIAQGQ